MPGGEVAVGYDEKGNQIVIGSQADISRGYLPSTGGTRTYYGTEREYKKGKTYKYKGAPKTYAQPPQKRVPTREEQIAVKLVKPIERTRESLFPRFKQELKSTGAEIVAGATLGFVPSTEPPSIFQKTATGVFQFFGYGGEALYEHAKVGFNVPPPVSGEELQRADIKSAEKLSSKAGEINLRAEIINKDIENLNKQIDINQAQIGVSSKMGFVPYSLYEKQASLKAHADIQSQRALTYSSDVKGFEAFAKSKEKTTGQKIAYYTGAGAGVLASSYLTGVAFAPVIASAGGTAIGQTILQSKPLVWATQHPVKAEAIAFAGFAGVPAIAGGITTAVKGGDIIDITASTGMPIIAYTGFRGGVVGGTKLLVPSYEKVSITDIQTGKPIDYYVPKNVPAIRVDKKVAEFYRTHQPAIEVSNIKMLEATRLVKEGGVLKAYTRQTVTSTADVRTPMLNEKLMSMTWKSPASFKYNIVGSTGYYKMGASPLLQTAKGESLVSFLKIKSPGKVSFIATGEMKLQGVLGGVEGGEVYKIMPFQTGTARMFKSGQIFRDTKTGIYAMKPYSPVDVGITNLIEVAGTTGQTGVRIYGKPIGQKVGAYGLRTEITSYDFKLTSKSMGGIESGTEYNLRGISVPKEGRAISYQISDILRLNQKGQVVITAGGIKDITGGLSMTNLQTINVGGMGTTNVLEGTTNVLEGITIGIGKMAGAKAILVPPISSPIMAGLKTTLMPKVIPFIRPSFMVTENIIQAKGIIPARELIAVRQLQIVGIKEMLGAKTITTPTTIPLQQITTITKNIQIPGTQFPSIVIPPIMPIVFPLALPSGGEGVGYTPGQLREQAFKYQPQFKALVLGIKGKAPETITGLEFRPIPYKKMKQRRR